MGPSMLIEWMNGFGMRFWHPPTDFTGVNDIVTNLAKEREPEIDDIEHTP